MRARPGNWRAAVTGTFCEIKKVLQNSGAAAPGDGHHGFEIFVPPACRFGFVPSVCFEFFPFGLELP